MNVKLNFINNYIFSPPSLKTIGKLAVKTTIIALTALAIGTVASGLVVGLGLTFGITLPIGLAVTATVLMLALAILKLNSYTQKNSSSRQAHENENDKPYRLANIDVTKSSRFKDKDNKSEKTLNKENFIKPDPKKIEENTTTWNQIPNAIKHIASQ